MARRITGRSHGDPRTADTRAPTISKEAYRPSRDEILRFIAENPCEPALIQVVYRNPQTVFAQSLVDGVAVWLERHDFGRAPKLAPDVQHGVAVFTLTRNVSLRITQIAAFDSQFKDKK